MPLLNLKHDEPLGYIEEYVQRSQFTDGGAAAGTYQMKSALPIGAQVLASLLTQVTGFTGDTSAVLVIGDGTDVDRYNTGTPSVFTTANQIAMGAASGTAVHTAAVFPTLTVTSASDFTNVTAGAFKVRIVYLKG